MDKNFLKYGLGLLILSVFASCEKEVTINVDPLEPQLVIHGFMNTHDSSEIYVESTDSIVLSQYGYEERVKLKTAKVVVSTSTGEKHQFYFNQLQQRFIGPPIKEGETLHLKVEHPQYKSASATCIVPQSTMVEGSWFKRSPKSEDPNQDNIQVDFKIKNATGKQYFMVNLKLQTIKTWGSNSDTSDFNSYFFSSYDLRFFAFNDPIDISSGYTNYIDAPGLFEKSLSSSDVTTQIYSNHYNYGTEFYSDVLKDLAIEISEITEDAYRYYATVQAEQWTNGDPFSSPVSIRSNIQDGLGIFMATNNSFNLLRDDN